MACKLGSVSDGFPTSAGEMVASASGEISSGGSMSSPLIPLAAWGASRAQEQPSLSTGGSSPRLEAGAWGELWGWRKLKGVWAPRIAVLSLDDFGDIWS